MNWTKHKHYSESDDGLWRITKTAQRRKTKTVMLYRLWLKNSLSRSWGPMGLFDSSVDAEDMVKLAILDELRGEV